MIILNEGRFKILLNLTVYLLIFHLFPRTNSFQSSRGIVGISRNSLTKSKPLSTAGDCASGFIPRLEPGLRILKKTFDSDLTTIQNFQLDWLNEFEVQNESSTSIEVHDLGISIFNKVKSLVSNASVKIKQLSLLCFNYVKRVVAASLIIASSLTSPSIRSISIAANSAIAAVASVPRVAHAVAPFRKYKNLSPTQKLATTPLYFLSNSRGNAYLQDDVQSGNPDQKIIVYFMSSEDASDYLSEMAQANFQSAQEFRITTVSMEKVVNQIKMHKQSRKLGRYSMGIVYRIQPSSRQCDNAVNVMGNGNVKQGEKLVQGISIPMFSASGLGIKRANGEVVYPYYFAYEDLMEDWNKMSMKLSTDSTTNKPLPKTPKVIVKDFTEVMCLSKGITYQSLFPNNNLAAIDSKTQSTKDVSKEFTPGIVPPRREIEMIKKYYRNQSGIKNEFAKSKLLG